VSAGSDKRARKGATLLFANAVGQGRGFGAVDNGGWLIGPEGPPEEILPISKEDLADLLIDRLRDRLPARATS
jgi:phosphopantothenoylcysteine synthetase/decarboxylase